MEIRAIWFKYILSMVVGGWWSYLPWYWNILPIWLRVVLAVIIGLLMVVASYVHFTCNVFPEAHTDNGFDKLLDRLLHVKEQSG